MTKKTTQIHVLERVRGEQEMSVPVFCAAIGVSRQWYYGQLKTRNDVFKLQALSELAMAHVGEWVGALAVECIRLIDPRFVPCPCQTAIGDNGDCPKHGVLVALVNEKSLTDMLIEAAEVTA